jgi:hypothetical protein
MTDTPDDRHCKSKMSYTRAPYAFESIARNTQHRTSNINRQEPVWKHQIRLSNPIFKTLSQAWMEHEQQQDYLFNIACAIQNLQFDQIAFYRFILYIIK